MAAMGGGTARNIPVFEDRRREREEPARNPEGRVVVSGVQTTRYQGTISLLSKGPGLEQVVQCFRSTWTKDPSSCPAVKAVFAVNNSKLKKMWEDYKMSLGDCYRGVETHFHGATLACDILNTRRLCGNSQCGICGISDNGFDPKCIQINEFQRLGSGFYLALNSSKCHGYTKTANGYKAMLLCDVLPGRKYTTRTRVNGPPEGYDSACGGSGGGGAQLSRDTADQT